MMLSEYLKPALGVVVAAALVGGWYWFEHRPRPEEKETPSNALVIVTKSRGNACFSDLVRVTGFIVPRREAVVGVDQEGFKVADVLVREGETVTENQELARLTPPPAQPGAGAKQSAPTSLRAPAAGLVTEVKTIVGAPASPQAGPMFRISVNNEIELDAEVPAVQMLKLNPGATVRVSRDNAPDMVGRVRLVSPQIDRTTQLGHIRISLTNNPSLKVGMFARANIDAKRSCGVAGSPPPPCPLPLQGGKRKKGGTRQGPGGLGYPTHNHKPQRLHVGGNPVGDAGPPPHERH